MSVNIGTRRWDSRGFWGEVRYTWRKRHCEQRKVEEGEQHLPFGKAKCVYFPTRTTAKLTQPCKLRTRTREKAAEKSGNVSFSTENERLLAGALLHRAAGLLHILGETKKTAVFRKMNTAVGATAMVFISPKRDRRESWQRPFPTD